MTDLDALLAEYWRSLPWWERVLRRILARDEIRRIL